jgi:hypothetical protein
MATISASLLAAVGVFCAAVLCTAPASAHTVCRPDGFCFNTSGAPIAPWQQPALRGGYAYYPYHYRHWRHYYYRG